MKNRKYELLRRLRKQYYRNNANMLHYENGIRAFHLYNGNAKHTLSWWDDVGFRLNDYHVVVWFVHPRAQYSAAVKDLAYDLVPRPKDGFDLFEGATPTIAKRGASRKAVAFWTMAETPEARRAYYAELNQTENRLKLESDIVIRPEFSVEPLAWCKGVEICVPLEVVDETGLRAVVDLAKRLLKGETTLAAEFGDYSYTKADWARDLAFLEAHKADSTRVDLIGHAVA